MSSDKQEQEGEESLIEKVGSWIAVVAVIIPSLIASGFMPDWNVLPFAGWFILASVGSSIGCFLAARRKIVGAFSGCCIGAGALLSIVMYVRIRSFLIGSTTFLDYELVLAAFFGALPGTILYYFVGHRKSR